MALTSIGDMARHFANLRQSGLIRDRLASLAQEVATGQAADPARHLGGRADRLALVDRDILLLEGRASAAKHIGHRLAAAQTALEGIEDLRKNTAADLIATPPEAGRSTTLSLAAKAAAAFNASVAALNGRFGTESLFNGNQTDQAPISEPDGILGALKAQILGGPMSPDTVLATVSAFFDGGDFINFYTGDTGAEARRQIEGGVSVALAPRADDPALREVLKNYAIAALAGDDDLPLSQSDRVDLLRKAGEGLVAAGDDLTTARARLGVAEEDVEVAVTRLTARLSSTKIIRNDLIAIDPGEAISQLRQVETQLETQYTVTARLAGFTLAGFLR